MLFLKLPAKVRFNTEHNGNNNMIILLISIILLITSFHIDEDTGDILRGFSLAFIGGSIVGFILF